MTEKSSSYSVRGYNFVTLLKRLEAATSRLEDITIYQEQARSASDESSVAGEVSPPSTSSTSSAPASAPAVAAAPVVPSKSPVVEGFEEFIAKFIDPFYETSKKIDGDVAKIVEELKYGFVEEKKLLEIIVLSSVTPIDKLVPHVTKIQEQIQKVNEFKEKYRGKLRNHVNSIESFVPILGWVVIETAGNNKPILSYVSNFADASKFWSDRVLKEFKDSDKNSVEWVKQLNAIPSGLKEYLNSYHGSGMAWNVEDGIPIDEAAKKVESSASSVSAAPPAAAAASAPPAAAAPPPPPPYVASVFETKEAPKESSSGSGMSAVFSQLSQGVGITKGLKKVDKSQMTHKNPELRSSSVVSAAKKPPKPPRKVSSSVKTKSKTVGKIELESLTWVVSDFENNHEIIVEGEMNQSVRIGKCSNCTITVKGKVNAISVAECDKVGILTDALVSGMDIIKTNKFQFQPLGFVPIINIDQSSDGEIYLGKDTINAEIFTSSSTGMNIYTADLKDDEGDMKEYAVPEQFKHVYDEKTGKMVSSIVDESM